MITSWAREHLDEAVERDALRHAGGARRVQAGGLVVDRRVRRRRGRGGSAPEASSASKDAVAGDGDERGRVRRPAPARRRPPPPATASWTNTAGPAVVEHVGGLARRQAEVDRRGDGAQPLRRQPQQRELRARCRAGRRRRRRARRRGAARPAASAPRVAPTARRRSSAGRDAGSCSAGRDAKRWLLRSTPGQVGEVGARRPRGRPSGRSGTRCPWSLRSPTPSLRAARYPLCGVAGRSNRVDPRPDHQFESFLSLRATAQRSLPGGIERSDGRAGHSWPHR